ncbi:MAG: YeeE/YedE family protein [Nitrospirae bacterium]|nr:YeeE/YedE family protein [Nitrospirota bacterium]
MKETNEASDIEVILKEGYSKVFYRNWPAWLGGLLIGITSIITFAWARPWGVVGGLREWVDWSFYSLGIYSSHPQLNPLLSTGSILTFGLLWGALSSSLFSKEFGIRVPPPVEFLRGAFGGILMGIGSAMAMGCNVGGFFSATSALSLSGPAMMFGLLIGAFLETRYLFWEMQRFRYRRGDGKVKKPKEGEFDWRNIQPQLGALTLLVVLALAYIYRANGIDRATGYDYIKTGGLLIAGYSFGMIMHRSRFAFQQALREPFVSGNADQARGMVIAVTVSVLGFAAIKYSGLRPEYSYVTPTFWTGSFVGGVIFGFGMPFAGGCASGVCWRTAEGGIKQLVAFLFLGITNSLAHSFISSSETLSSMMGEEVFLPEYITYHWSVILILSVMLLYYIVMSWNEKTGKFI